MRGKISYLQGHDNPIYYLGIYQRLIPLNVNNDVKLFRKLLERLSAAFSSFRPQFKQLIQVL